MGTLVSYILVLISFCTVGNLEVTDINVFSVCISRLAKLLVSFNGKCTLFLLRISIMTTEQDTLWD